MPKFYNKTRGPLSFSSRDGSPLFVGPKSFIEIEAGDVTSDVLSAKSSGDLVQIPDEEVHLVPETKTELEKEHSSEIASPPVFANKPVGFVAKESEIKETTEVSNAKFEIKKPVDSRRSRE